MDTLFKLSVMINMIDNITQPSKLASESVGKMTNKLQNLNAGFSNIAKGGMIMTGMGAGITAAALSPVGAVFETRKALGELASLGVTDLQAVETAAKSFSDTWAGTTKADFISASYDIKSGIASLNDEAVAKFTEMAGVTAKATKSSTSEMTSLFATGYGIYKDYYNDLSDFEFGEMFSAGISKSVQAFKTDGSKMAQSIQTLGASATTSSVPLEEQLSILGMLQATMGGSEAGTKYKAFLGSASKAGKALELSFTDANNQLLSMPEILTILKGKFGETMDAAEKMELQKAFGTDEAVSLIDLLYGKTDDLQSNILTLYDTMGNGMSVATDMANAINQTEGEKFTLLQQRIQNTVETIGNAMLPTINDWLDKGAVLVEHISTWISDNSELAGTIMITVAIIGIIITAVGILSTAIGFVGGMFTKTITTILKLGSGIGKLKDCFDTLKLKAIHAGDSIRNGFTKTKTASTSVISSIGKVTSKIVSMGKAVAVNGFNAIKSFTLGMANMAKQAITTAVTALPGLIAGVWSFTTALLANPITWIVIAIIALVVALVLLWQNWDTVSAWLSDTWNGIVQGVMDGWNWLRGILEETPTWLLVVLSAFLPFIGIPLLIIQNWDTIKEFFSGLWNGIKDGFNTFFNEFIPTLLESGKNIINKICEGIGSVITKPVEMIKGAFSSVRNLLPFSDAKEGPLSELTLSGSKIFTTIGEGMETTKSIPSSLTQEAFKDVNTDMDIETMLHENMNLDFENFTMPDLDIANIENPYDSLNSSFQFNDMFKATDENINFDTLKDTSKYKVDLKEIVTTSEKETIKKESKDNNITYNVTINVDLKELKDLDLLKQLLDSVKDEMNKTTMQDEDEIEESA